MNRPLPEEFAPFYKKYIDTVSDDVPSELERQCTAFPDFIRSIPLAKGDFAYAEGKWTVRELLGHTLDTERIMAYRALRIARNDQTPLPGFEEDAYTLAAHYDDRSLESLAAEFNVLRSANLFLVRSFREEELSRIGTASNQAISCRALVFILAGHLNHHWKILEERYL